MDMDAEIPQTELKMWMKKAREQTKETLLDFFKEVDLIPPSYGNAVHKTAICTVATAWAIQREQQGGITGFQAGAVMWEFIRFWESKESPLKLVDYENMLYPQYDYHFEKIISKSTWDWLQKKAKEELQSGCGMCPEVREHMEKIVMGMVPFGYIVKDD